MESFDILDGEGKPTGEVKLRSLVHQDGDWHNVAHIYIFRQETFGLEFLVHLRSSHKDLNPNRWDTRFGGHVKAGDTIEKTVLTELKEEVGINASLGELIKGLVVKWDGVTNREFAHIYFYKFEGNEKELKFNDGEVQEVKWMTVDGIVKEAKDNPEQWTGGASEGFLGVVDALRKKLS